MSHRKTSTALLLFVISFFVNSCLVKFTPTAIASFTPESLPTWLVRFTDTPKCYPPCWEHIIPSETTLDVAKIMLSTNSDIQDLYVEDTIPFGKTLLWLNGSAPVNDKDVVQMIWLRIAHYGVSLDQVISFYGNPQYVIFSNWYSNIISIDLLFPDIGMVIRLSQFDQGYEPNNVEVNVSFDDELSDIMFFAPGLDYYYTKMIRGSSFQQYDWKGYQTYP